MDFIIKYLIVLFTIFQCLKCDIEYPFDKIDELSTDILNEETATKICQNDTAKFWNYFYENIDLNKNTLIDSNELKEYLLKQIKKTHTEDINEQINRLDPQKSGEISFKSYVLGAFERSFEDLELIEAENSEEHIDLINFYKFEKNKWNFISSQADQLDYLDFYKYVYSEEFPNYNDYESKIRFDTFDVNKDQVIDVKEFKEAARSVDETLIDSKTQKFTKSIDLNEDNYLNRHEFQRWYNPTLEQIIHEQKQQLFIWCDNDSDGYLNQTEIIKNCKILLQNQITNFGLDFQTKETSQKHTEL